MSTSERGRNIIRYSGMAFEMMAVILLAIFGGRYIDNHLSLDKPYFVMLFLFLGLTVYLYRLIKQVSK